jgi:sialate O-acetylesterase
MIGMRAVRQAAALAAIWAVAWSASAELRMPSIFGDGMVLQRDVPVKVWGWASPGERIRLELAGMRTETVTAPSGRWQATLTQMRAGGPHTLRVSGDGGRVTIDDVLVGEVWVCSGQSNMQWPIERSKDPEHEIANATYPGIRMFTVTRTSAAEPQDDCEGSWAVTSPETAPQFSAVGYFFAQQLHRTLGIPIGMLHTSWGGTPVESWISGDTMRRLGDGAHMVARYEEAAAAHEAAMQAYREEKAAWDEAKAAGNDPGPEPKQPQAGLYGRDSWRPTGLFNAMVAPLIPYTIRGAIWYQGESNAGRAYQYRKLFPAMIEDWRFQWGQNQFPFYFVQLANFNAGEAQTWPELREAQSMALRLQHTGMAVTIDIGDPDDIHPTNKQEVGRRLALLAMSGVYGINVYQSGPVYSDMRVEGDTIRLVFQRAWKGLIAEAGPLMGFEVAGENRVFHPATATIEKNTVLVRSESVPNPVAARYAWANNPAANLYNGTGLPASPFRTDSWPGITVDAR